MEDQEPDPESLFLELRDLPQDQWESQLCQRLRQQAERDQVRDWLRADRAVCKEDWLKRSPLDAYWPELEETKTFLMDPTNQWDHAAEQTDATGPLPDCIDRYEPRELLGSGSFARVYRAYDPILKDDVALKVSRELMDSDDAREKFLTEARNLRALKHENIVRVENAGFCGDQAFIVMEYVNGTNLRDYLRDHQELTIEEIVRIVAPIANAMGFAHTNSIVHRDLKPANILIATDGIPKVADFGLAIRDDMQNRRDYAGTTSYMSPEQIRCESDDLYGSADRWALGVILYEMLSGRRPFEGTTQEKERAILTKSPKPLREIRPQVPERLQSLCERCLEKSAKDRPGSAYDIEADLTQIVAPRNIGRRSLILGAIGLAIAFLIWLYANNHTANPNNRGFRKSGVVYSLLDRKPDELVPDYNGATPSANTERQEFSAISSGYGLYTLGINESGSFQFDVEIVKSAHEGWSGAFFGAVEDNNELRCLVVRLSCNKSRRKGNSAAISVDRLLFHRTVNGHWKMRSHGSIAVESVKLQTQITQRLSIRADGGRLIEVAWNGQPLRKISIDLESYRRKRSFEENLVGLLGLANYRGPCVYKMPRYRWED